MQPGFRRFLLFRLRPAPFSLVLSGLVLAALAPAGPAIAGEVAPGGPPALWHDILPDDGETGFPQYLTGVRGLPGLEFLLREVDESLLSHGLFFRAGDGLRIGAQGSFDPDAGDLRAIVALKLNF